MIRASCAYGGGWLGVVIVGGDAPPLRLLHTQSLELGRSVDRAEPLVGRRKSWDKIRAITPDQVAELGNAVLAMLLARGVEAVTFGLPRGPVSAHLEEIAAMIDAAGLAVERVDAPEVRGEGARVLPLVEATIPGWPTGKGPMDGDAEVCRRAAALLLPGGAREAVRGLVAAPIVPLTMEGAPLPERDQRDIGVHREPLPTAESPTGARRGSIDPGTASVGVVVAAGDAPPLTALYVDTLPIGRLVPLVKPTVKVLGDGSEKVTTHKREVTENDIAILVAQVVKVFHDHGVEEAVIEWTPHLHTLDSGAGAAARSGHVTRTQFIAGALFGVLLREGFKVSLVVAATWRAKIAGRRGAGGGVGGKGRLVASGKRDIAPAVAAGFTNWPPLSDVHERDAGGVNLWAATRTPPKEPRPPRPRHEPGAPRVRVRPEKTDHRAELRRKAEARELAGCGCGGKRHRSVCSLSKPMPFRGWAESGMPAEEWTATLSVRRDAARAYGDNDGWCALTKPRRDAITRARVVLPTFDVRAEFGVCQVCRRPASDASGPLEPSEITCSCPRRAG